MQMPSSNQLFYSGTSGLDLPVPRSQYPAEFQRKSRLQYYASLFNTLEVNSIFYKLPRSSTVANWAESVPANFRFTFKLSKTITHAKGLQFGVKDVEDFMKIVDPSWYEREVHELLQEYDAAMVLQDMPKSVTPFKYATGNFIYLRFHGPEPRYRGSYTDEFLKRYATHINAWIGEKKTVYAYFNNTAGAAVENLQTLNKFEQL